MKKLLCIVGPLPPPHDGLSAINEAVAQLAGQGGLEVQRFDTSPKIASPTLARRLSRLAPFAQTVSGVRTALRNNGAATVYCSVSGGLGILGEMAIVRVARAHGARLLLHHHSFRYLDQPYAPMKMLTRLAGPEAIHILLGSNMETALSRRYPDVKHTLVMSNAAFFGKSAAGAVAKRGSCRVVGHLSNLSAAKGLMQIVELAEWASTKKLDFEFRVAGPIENGATQKKFCARAKQLKNLRYLGPLYGAEKENFFESLDAFVFPTQYRNEAEPLVLLEAMGHSCPIIAYDRGCISNLIDPSCGALIPKDRPFLNAASSALTGWHADPGLYAGLRREAAKKYCFLIDQAGAARGKLLEALWSHK